MLQHDHQYKCMNSTSKYMNSKSELPSSTGKVTYGGTYPHVVLLRSYFSEFISQFNQHYYFTGRRHMSFDSVLSSLITKFCRLSLSTVLIKIVVRACVHKKVCTYMYMIIYIYSDSKKKKKKRDKGIMDISHFKSF